MECQLRHNGLISCPFEWDRKPVICWLRLYEDPTGSPKWFVVVTEVPGNPGGSISNQHGTVQSAIVDQFGVDLDSVVWFHAWPVGCFSSQSSWSKIDGHGFAVNGQVTRADVERLVGEKLPDLPEHEMLYQKVLDLGGGVWDEAFLPIFDALPVDELPPPHLPASCHHLERFETIYKELPESDDWIARSLEAGQLFLNSLTQEDLVDCYYHKDNWRAIADESVRIFEQVGDHAGSDEYVASAQKSKLTKRDKEWLISLFGDPIFIGGGSYTSGQHRACALRFSGAERAAVHVDDESLGEVCTDWTYGGGG